MTSFEDLSESGVVVPNVIPTFPIPIDLDYDESFYSVNVSVLTNIAAGCLSGFICNKTHQASCHEIQQVAKTDFGYGDIHGGSYCPQGVPYYLNCPLGHYCPDPETLLPCPAGFYCPHKTAVPAIVCHRCPEGSEVLVRDTFGIVLIILFMVVVTVYLASFFFQRHMETLKVKFESLSSRVLQHSDLERRLHQRQARLDRVRPKLEILNRRLQIHGLHDNSSGGLPVLTEESMNGSTILDSSTVEVAPVHVSPEGEVSFNAEEFFDAIDRDGNGVLSYEELNTVLQFDELELNEFVRHMNCLDEALAPTDLNHVIKPTFVRYFLDVLDETSNFRLTPEEAGLRWDEVFAANGSDSKGEIQLDALYESSIAQFMTDLQIKDIILGLRKAKVSSPSQGGSSFFVSDSNGISRDLFCKHYPTLLEAILNDQKGRQSQGGDTNRKDGIDIAFQHLQLAVKVGRDKYINVVDDVTGRIQKGTMTALLGGSGAGKTSLLNALCGRAYYGEVKGDVYINGSPASTEDFSDSIGFVPQDDIVFAELTVRENLMYSGRFRLPQGTSLYEIEDLADTVLANLGLSRKANSIVGDVTRRGVSGGEKKRVNIGLELMARPTAIFCDEPTSGLDSSSALLVMESLAQLVRNQGVTVCSVIHQPRKFIFDLFDSLLLLGVGGRMVYHGTVEDANPYFTSLGYTLPPGESLADWLIDISTGRIAACKLQEQIDEESGENVPLLQRQASLGLALKKVSMSSRFTDLSVRDGGGARSEGGTSVDGFEAFSDVFDAPTRLDTQVVTAAGPSSNMQQTAESAAKLRRELLYASWNDHFEHADDESRKKYDPPTPYDPPRSTVMPSFGVQFMLQMQRTILLAWRNRVTKTIETAIIVFAVAIISYFEGTASLTEESVPLVPFEAFIAGQEEVIVAFFQPLFEFSLRGSVGYLRYGVSVGVIASVLIALTSVKAITEKRLEFYREAGSGYNINSYFLAVNVFTSFDQGGQVLFAAVIAQWLLDSISNKAVFYVAFLLLAWISVSWALLIPLITPPKNTLVMLGFFMAFFGLLFGGTTPPVEYKDMYADDGTAKALFAAFFSPPRFFTETIAVSDLKCLPPQTGFTQTDEAYNFPDGKDSFAWVSLGQNDSNVTDLSSNGWYWGILPGFLVGLTIRVVAFGAINSLNRAQMAKKSFLFQLRNKGSFSLYLSVAAFWLCLGGLIGVTCWMILREV
mmetsp:Transcript_20466/g.33924  ORF Transcript_20466/g.33924 Transcript_20466/m.33924 type:complete len:1212 (+) Transcript_20466:224-3859(+)|eukprot:CAMPEP_0119024530 /NCGR_PEP_ID=MMETSP1176-20130426/32051_1 /TAXON_ID=265551 /ORGANISM="Synedropsis recta cf, Strain CCMP1620" /LENGTH=1211 /DNA_ID=CAMNT_0006979855 /DNA_START=146 /DNA_END=3781 /DNA_ORIENTATION=+